MRNLSGMVLALCLALTGCPAEEKAAPKAPAATQGEKPASLTDKPSAVAAAPADPARPAEAPAANPAPEAKPEARSDPQPEAKPEAKPAEAAGNKAQ